MLTVDSRLELDLPTGRSPDAEAGVEPAFPFMWRMPASHSRRQYSLFRCGIRTRMTIVRRHHPHRHLILPRLPVPPTQTVGILPGTRTRSLRLRKPTCNPLHLEDNDCGGHPGQTRVPCDPYLCLDPHRLVAVFGQWPLTLTVEVSPSGPAKGSTPCCWATPQNFVDLVGLEPTPETQCIPGLWARCWAHFHYPKGRTLAGDRTRALAVGGPCDFHFTTRAIARGRPCVEGAADPEAMYCRGIPPHLQMGRRDDCSRRLRTPVYSQRGSNPCCEIENLEC